ncbi:MAG: hypothetical protein PWQ37_2465 [Candidatus Petromonas sp.]|jgi:hypothetical protein|nr:hypothetical protein [Candidatus Petromonas sp.]
MVNTIIKTKLEVMYMKYKLNIRKIIIYMLTIMISITSLYYLYNKFSNQKPIAAKLVMDGSIDASGCI